MDKEPAGEKVKVITNADEFTFNGVIKIPSTGIIFGVVYETPNNENTVAYDVTVDVPDGITIAVNEFETGKDGTAIDCIAATDSDERCTISAQEESNLCHIHNKEADNDDGKHEKDVNEYVINYTSSFQSKRVIGIVTEGKISFYDNDYEYHTYGRITQEFLDMVTQMFDMKRSSSNGHNGFN